jgi:succinoglycan biosynthesis transport protein ExoP
MQEEVAQPFEIKRYIATIKRRKYIALLAGLIVLSLFTWGSFLIPKIYEASSMVFIEKSSMINPLISGVGVPSNIEDRLRVLINSITSRNIVERAIKKLGMDANSKDAPQYEGIIESIRKNLNIKVSGPRQTETDMFIISYRDVEPIRARDMVNTLVSEYIEENASYRRTDASEAYEFIQNQVLEYKSKLEESDRAIREFRERNPNLIPQTEATLLGRLEGFQGSKIEADIKMKELMRKRDSIQKQLSGEKELTVAFVTREGSPQAQLNYLNNKLMLLLSKYTENYPEVLKVKAEIEELKKQMAQAKDLKIEGGAETSTLNPIYQQLKEELTRTESEIESLRARSTELSRQQQETQRILGSMPKEQEEWTKLQRDRNVYQQIYDQLLQKLENARVSKELEFTDKSETFRIVDPATTPLFPVKPNRLKLILLGIFLGIASGIGAVFGLEYFDHSFKDVDSIETSLKLPVLAMIPKIVTEDDELSAKRFERKVFIATGTYLSIIGLVLIQEILSRYMGIRIINF